MKLIKPSVTLNNNWHISRKFLIVLISVFCITTLGSTNTISQSNQTLAQEGLVKLMQDSNIVLNSDTIKVKTVKDEDSLIKKSFKNISTDLKEEIVELKKDEIELKKIIKKKELEKEDKFLALNKN